MFYLIKFLISKTKTMKVNFTLLMLTFSLSAMAQNLFPPLDTNYRAREIRVASSLKFDVLYEGNRYFVWDETTKQYAVSKTCSYR